MIFAGVDVGSMSAEAVLLNDDKIIASSIIVVKPNPSIPPPRSWIRCCRKQGWGTKRLPSA